MSDFKLTYATMFAPPAALHERFDQALQKARSNLGAEHALFIGGEDVTTGRRDLKYTPIDRRVLLGSFQVAGPAQVQRALRAATEAFPGWSRRPWQERVDLSRRIAELIELRVYDLAAALALEVGKNRMEALGEAQEVADFFRIYADHFEQHRGFAETLPDDPIPGCVSHNRSVLKPYGAWVVIAPFNFPLALAAGPTAAALVTGNTVVLKGAEETPWAGRLLAEVLRDAGLPPGVFNYLHGSGEEVGEALTHHEQTCGITFTGSHAVGLHIAQAQAAAGRLLPFIAEMGGKNATIVTRHADLECAATGIVRSAFGLQGQKCSALSRLYVERSVADALSELICARMRDIKVGDPTVAAHWMGPVATESAYRCFGEYCDQLRSDGARILSGGEQLRDRELENGFYCAPTFAEAPAAHRLWQQEMFVPILMLRRVADRDEAMALTNASAFGLTAGFYGAEEEVPWFFDNVEAGVTYANRPQGATTGAWPGYQPFGGWKGSGSTGKAIASFYYLPQYLREQSQTHVR